MVNPVTLGGAPVSINYLNRDYVSVRADLLARASDPALFPEWNNFSPADPGVGLIELASHLYDIQSFYNDRWGNEGFFRTAFLRRSVIDLAESQGYILRPKLAAQVAVQLNYQNVPGGGFTRLAGTVYSTTATPAIPSVSFELLEDLDVPASGTYEAELIHASTIGPETLGTSDGSINQRYQLSQSPITYFASGISTVVVEVDEGTFGSPIWVTWLEVEGFANSRPDDRHFRTFINEDDVVFAIFGDGVRGRVPSSASSIRATYKIGGGIDGNAVPRNAIDTAPTAGLPGGVTETVTNPDQPAGGLDRETIENAKFWAPKQFKTHGDPAESTARAVTHGDYEALAAAAGAVAARAGRGQYPHVERVVVAVGGSNPVPSGSWDFATQTGSGTLGTIGAFLVNRSDKLVDMQKPVVVEIEASFVVHVFDGFRQSDILTLIEDELLTQLSVEELKFDGIIPLSFAHQRIENLTGVDFVEDEAFRRLPVVWGFGVFAESSKAAFSAIAMDDRALDQVYTLTFITATTFSVESSVTGIQTQAGDISGGPDTWISDNADLTFTVTQGTIVNVPGDTYKIRTMPKVGKVVSEDREILRLVETNLTLQAVGGSPV